MSEVLHVSKRTEFGTRQSQRLRRNGKLPAVLYGHGKGTVTLTLAADEFEASLRHGAKVVDLAGEVKGQALLQEVQWDTFFQHVLHVDLLRVVAGEKVTVSVPVELRGEAPGTHDGGVVEQPVHEISIEVAPANLPEKLHLNINSLELDQSLTAADIEDLPEGATIIGDLDEVLVQCVTRAVELEEEELAAAGEVEPEVIGQKPEDEEGEESEA